MAQMAETGFTQERTQNKGLESQSINVLPAWMNKTEAYIPQKDKEGFLTKSLLGFLRLFRHFYVVKNENISEISAGNRLLLVLILIVFCAVSPSVFFIACVAALFLAVLCVMKLEVLKKTLATALTAALFTLLIMLPSFFIYKTNTFIIVSVKVFLSTGMLTLFSLTTPWNKITAALRSVKIPGFIIFIIDLTLHYILILGNIAYDMLFALKLRSVGKNQSKKNAFSGILGTVFLKAIVFSEETQQSMECRLFDENYSRKKGHIKANIHFKDFIPIFVLILYSILFVLAG